MAMPANARATVGLVCIDILAFFSTSFWRNRYYNIFLVSHVIAVVGLFASVRTCYISHILVLYCS